MSDLGSGVCLCVCEGACVRELCASVAQRPGKRILPRNSLAGKRILRRPSHDTGHGTRKRNFRTVDPNIFTELINDAQLGKFDKAFSAYEEAFNQVD